MYCLGFHESEPCHRAQSEPANDHAGRQDENQARELHDKTPDSIEAAAWKLFAPENPYSENIARDAQHY